MSHRSYIYDEDEKGAELLLSETSSMLPLDTKALDALCINCYECVRYTEVDAHSKQC